MKEFGLMVLITGLVLVVIGAGLLLAGRLPSWLGHLPGDIHFQAKGWGFSFPVITCLLASVVLTLFLNLILRFWGK